MAKPWCHVLEHCRSVLLAHVHLRSCGASTEPPLHYHPRMHDVDRSPSSLTMHSLVKQELNHLFIAQSRAARRVLQSVLLVHLHLCSYPATTEPSLHNHSRKQPATRSPVASLRIYICFLVNQQPRHLAWPTLNAACISRNSLYPEWRTCCVCSIDKMFGLNEPPVGLAFKFYTGISEARHQPNQVYQVLLCLSDRAGTIVWYSMAICSLDDWLPNYRLLTREWNPLLRFVLSWRIFGNLLLLKMAAWPSL